MKRNYSLLIILFGVILFSAGCSVPFIGNQKPESEQTATYEAMVIDAMKTAIGEITQQASLNPSVTATNTQIPATLTLVPSHTPRPPATATSIPPTATPLPPTASLTATATRTDFNCQVISSAPSWNLVYPPGGDFDGRWTFKNTGSEIWDKEKVDFKFVSGSKFQVRVDKLNLPNSVNKGESIELIIDMLAPHASGTYSATWALQKDNGTFCPSVIQIIVK